ncbi:ABC transporter substrate-binding protein [Cesiribacter sp. SM1]|uniref:ABC transporter substrate-binding protein n=1 Tax=Cesiribacter sp. SM1 TaxID=2861196 RepID=UPI001CD4710E|nr:helical backbone metal receptor [Cesiribacter sp. SM1]
MNRKSTTFTDQMGRQITVEWPPRRIISLVPSQTELLYTLELEEQVVGLTKFCLYPEHWRKQKKVIGGTKTPQLDRIKALQPDLIIGNKEENEQESIEVLAREFPVWMSDIYNLEDALQMMRMLGGLTNRNEEAEKLVATIVKAFAGLPLASPVSVLYLIWQNPWMGVGNTTFVHNMLELCGFRNVLEDSARYPRLSDEALQQLNPEVVLLSSEPYPFKEKHMAALQELLPKSKLLLVDGEMFSWYGSRLLQAPQYFREVQERIVVRE